MPADPTLSYSPTAVALSPSAAVCAVIGRRAGGSEIGGAPSMPSVSSACTLILPIWAYFIADWSPDGRMQNDYITSPRLFSADTVRGI